jgi:hypothetical protein
MALELRRYSPTLCPALRLVQVGTASQPEEVVYATSEPKPNKM